MLRIHAKLKYIRFRLTLTNGSLFDWEKQTITHQCVAEDRVEVCSISASGPEESKHTKGGFEATPSKGILTFEELM